ncbi:MAG: glycosyltransferase family 1 protein [Acidimicrobiia bacterium]|nr:glycosyltransferase family 1 protein [Acidimicrobiia bacterium]
MVTSPRLSPRLPSELRIAWLLYRGNPHCGGQGVYTRYIVREAIELGHHVEVLSGQPWPELDDPQGLVKVPSLDLYPSGNPFRVPWPWEFRDSVDVREFGIMCSGVFPEPWAFSERARRVLRTRRPDFDLVHDNQSLGTGLLGMMADGFPLCATLHHPITVDRDLELAHASSAWRRFNLRRWYAFLNMQMKVARSVPRIITVSENSRRDIISQMGVPEDRMHIVPVGVDQDVFKPLANVERVSGRLLVTTSSDQPLKGLVPLLEAVAKVRTERDEVHLVVIGKPKEGSTVPALLDRLGLTPHVTFVSGVPTERIVELYAECELAVVPSLYEGFSLPAIEAMSCAAPLVTTTGGALPEVTGPSGEAALTVPPNDADALAGAIRTMLEDTELRTRLGSAGRARVLNRFTWRRTALEMIDNWYELLDAHVAVNR